MSGDRRYNDIRGLGLHTGDRHYRAFVGPVERYEVICALYFNLLTFLGLSEHHFVLDIGCGSLRGGKVLIPYLLPERYYGIEPEQWLIDEGIKHELGKDIIDIKKPVFSNEGDFNLSLFNRKFDYIIAQSIFTHAAPHQISKCMAEARKVMKPSSFFVANFFRGEDNFDGDSWAYPQCVTYTIDFMTGMVEQNGLKCTPTKWNHPQQEVVWLIITDPANTVIEEMKKKSWHL